MKRMWSKNEVKNLSKEVIESGAVENAKPIYWHTLFIQRGGTADTGASISRVLGYVIILNNSEALITQSEFLDMLKTEGFVAVLHSGKGNTLGDVNLTNLLEATKITYSNGLEAFVYIRDATTNIESYFPISIDSGWAAFQDLGANKIN